MYIGVESGTLFAILTRTERPGARLGVVFAGGGHLFSAQRNRLPVRLCRSLASVGIPALRFDYLGLGESTGPAPALYRLDQPFAEQTAAAARTLERHGVPAYVLAGNCFGARSALEAARSLGPTAGVVLIVPPIGDAHSGEGSLISHLGGGMKVRTYAWKGIQQVLRGVLRERLVRKYLRRAAAGLRLGIRAGGARIRRRGRVDVGGWVSLQFTAALSELADRHIPVLLVYGEDDPHLRHFRHASGSGALGEALTRMGDLVEVRTVPGEVEGFATIEAQQAVLEIVEDWIVRRADGLSPSRQRNGARIARRPAVPSSGSWDTASTP